MKVMLLAASALLAAVTSSVAAPLDAPIVSTKDGQVQGSFRDGVYTFLGMHYGANTGGANRFLPPQPVQPWNGVKPALKMGDRCPQPPLNHPGAVIIFSEDPISENCLDLNVWTPALDGAKRAVMVWLHGGGFAFGSANDKYYDGKSLAKNGDVVVVSLNHRLNGFGYLDLGPEAGPAFSNSANVGQLDIVFALQWVRANIARFGGDPANITVFGQSGGGGKVSTLLAMPAAEGLFQKAIIESGADIHQSSSTSALAQRDRVLTALNLAPTDVLKLRDLPMQALVAAFTKAGLLGFRPFIDGIVIPSAPFSPNAPQTSADVPLLVGTAHDEATDFALIDPNWQSMTEAELRSKITPLVGQGNVDEAITLYRKRAPAEPPFELYASVLTDYMFTHKAQVMAVRKSAQPAPVFMYRTDWNTSVLGGILRAPHGVELPFVFDTVAVAPELVGPTPQPNMVDLFQKTFVAFARTGNPNVEGYPRWPAFNAMTRMTFIYDWPPHVVSDPDPQLRHFWDKITGDSSDPINP